MKKNSRDFYHLLCSLLISVSGKAKKIDANQSDEIFPSRFGRNARNIFFYACWFV